MKTPIERFRSAVNVLPLREECFVPINNFIKQVPHHAPIQPTLSYSSDASLVQFSLTGSPQEIVSSMVQYFVNCDAHQSELQNIERIARKLNPQKIGFFLRQEGDSSSIGWTIPENQPWSAITGHLPLGSLRSDLRSWMHSKELQNVLQYSRVIGPGAQWEELTLSVPDVETALSFYEKHKMVLPPEPLLEEIALCGSSKLGLCIWISSKGTLIRLALRIFEPSIRLTLASRLALESLPDSTMALIEGFLETKAPSWIEVGLNANGRDALTAYQG